MPHAKVEIQWRKGLLGDGGTFTFSPNPFLERATPGKRTATLTVPLLDGVIIQQLGLNERTINLRGVLFNKTKTWDDMEVQRNELINGLRDTNLKIAHRSARMLGSLGEVGEPAVPNLIKALSDPDLRGDAVIALGWIGPSANAAIPFLIQTYFDAVYLNNSTMARYTIATIRRISPEVASEVELK